MVQFFGQRAMRGLIGMGCCRDAPGLSLRRMMRVPAFRTKIRSSAILALTSVAMVCFGAAQSATQPDYLNPSLAPEQRAADLVKRMTLEEKASQLVNQARAIPRLNIPQ